MPFELIYNSIADLDITEKDIKDILKEAIDFNSKNKITGCLLFHNMEFLQILEGEREIILELYGKLLKDKRHNTVTLINQAEISSVLFSDWSMAFKELSDSDMLSLKNHINIKDFHQLINNLDRQTVSKDLFVIISKAILS